MLLDSREGQRQQSGEGRRTCSRGAGPPGSSTRQGWAHDAGCVRRAPYFFPKKEENPVHVVCTGRGARTPCITLRWGSDVALDAPRFTGRAATTVRGGQTHMQQRCRSTGQQHKAGVRTRHGMRAARTFFQKKKIMCATCEQDAACAPLHHPPLGVGRRVGCSLIHGKGSDNIQGRADAHAAEVQVHRAAALAGVRTRLTFSSASTRRVAYNLHVNAKPRQRGCCRRARTATSAAPSKASKERNETGASRERVLALSCPGPISWSTSGSPSGSNASQQPRRVLTRRRPAARMVSVRGWSLTRSSVARDANGNRNAQDGRAKQGRKAPCCRPGPGPSQEVSGMGMDGDGCRMLACVDDGLHERGCSPIQHSSIAAA
jgi:hypothetical protein